MRLADWCEQVRSYNKGANERRHWCPVVPGWRVTTQIQAPPGHAGRGRTTFWRDVDGDFLILIRDVPHRFPDLSDVDAVRRYCYKEKFLGEDLVQADVVESVEGPAVMYIGSSHREPIDPIYLSMSTDGSTPSPPIPSIGGTLILAPSSGHSSVWMLTANERGTTGIREATIASTLMQPGRLTLNDVETAWAQDFYSSYAGVDRRAIRKLSDDERYDQQFPQHPLSKVRRELKKLLNIKLQE
jgi:hypothetical protein